MNKYFVFLCINLVIIGSMKADGEDPLVDLGHETSRYIVQMYLAGNATAQCDDFKDFQDVTTHFGTISMTYVHKDQVILRTTKFLSALTLHLSYVSTSDWDRSNLVQTINTFPNYDRLNHTMRIDNFTTINAQELKNGQIEVECMTYVQIPALFEYFQAIKH